MITILSKPIFKQSFRHILCHFSVNVKSVNTNKVVCLRTIHSNMKDTTIILKKLRNLMQNVPNVGAVNAYIVPSDDAHQSEYIAARDERRAFVSGFDGSAGTVIVTETEALLWTDGRYYQQATKQLDNNWTLMKDGLPTTLSMDKWLAQNLAKGSKVGVDPNLISCLIWNTIHRTIDANDISLIPIEQNLIDLIWDNQPSAPANKVITISTDITGKTISEKLLEVHAAMLEKRTDTLVISALDEIAWFLNMRGSDIEYNPVFVAYLIITLNDIHLFIDESKLPNDYENHFNKNNVKIKIQKYNTVKDVLTDLVTASTSKIWINIGSSFALNNLIPDKKKHQEITPICLMKAIKNPIEVNGLVNCHIRDGIALCKYFSWLEKSIQNGDVVNEISGATKLEEFRKKLGKFMGLSFTTISSSGPNASVIHYHPREETNREITSNEIYLCDSGAQFLDGTTDVTRTMHFGTPTEYQKKCYTLVLKGQITLGTTIFPVKTKGHFLDTLARKSLWDYGLDYGHGTSHGIGHFLNVHEGPMGISYKVMPDDPGLQENMFISNEPGYYEDGKFGIRIEDIVRIVPAKAEHNFNGRGALTFQTVTMCPIQTKLILPELLTEKEKNHLNSYHKKVFDTLSPILKEEGDEFTLKWLQKETQSI